ncbi:ribose-5-phosphate isomerase A [Striga asiatica]|uniref:Ribose-5-phosphate isomerase A n=1 Tax=Striga asiatica TaxID=4170 RepID=A0A5A7P4Q5_STRAF|nr:ribose-5-phosphate isomerase A [Striga asiatica]
MGLDLVWKRHRLGLRKAIIPSSKGRTVNSIPCAIRLTTLGKLDDPNGLEEVGSPVKKLQWDSTLFPLVLLTNSSVACSEICVVSPPPPNCGVSPSTEMMSPSSRGSSKNRSSRPRRQPSAVRSVLVPQIFFVAMSFRRRFVH